MKQTSSGVLHFVYDIATHAILLLDTISASLTRTHFAYIISVNFVHTIVAFKLHVVRLSARRAGNNGCLFIVHHELEIRILLLTGTSRTVMCSSCSARILSCCE